MLISEGIAGKRFLKFGSIVELLGVEKENDDLFADFPIGATIQDGGKRKRSMHSTVFDSIQLYFKISLSSSITTSKYFICNNYFYKILYKKN